MQRLSEQTPTHHTKCSLHPTGYMTRAKIARAPRSDVVVARETIVMPHCISYVALHVWDMFSIVSGGNDFHFDDRPKNESHDS